MTDESTELEACGEGTTTNCPLVGVHEHTFRGPHRFHEWEPGLPQRPAASLSERPPGPELADLPDLVIVDQHGHYWRDFGAFLSMCPVSDENSKTETAAVYVRAVRRESRDGSGPARYVPSKEWKGGPTPAREDRET